MQDPAADTTLAQLVEEVARRRDEFEALSHVPRDMVQTMKRAGIFRASTPQRFGGTALAPHRFYRSIERIAEADGSTAWVAAFGSANVYLAALPLATQAEIYRDGPDQVFSGALYPVQPAERIEGGWTVHGRWKFASGCKGADWLGVGISGGEAGRPLTAVMPPQQVEIIDNWSVVGMQATGSHDLMVQRQQVMDAWTFIRGGAALVDEPLYRYPGVSYQAGVHAAVNIGLANAALAVVIAMAGGQATTTGAPRLADRPHFRIELARAQAQLLATREFFYTTAEQAWDTILAGDTLPLERINLLRLSAIQVAQTSADVVLACYKLGGIASIYRSHPLQRILRDALVVTQHAFLGESGYDAAGAVFAGAKPFAGYP